MSRLRSSALLAVATAGLALAEDPPKKNEAEEVFAKFEERLVAARTLRVVCRAKSAGEDGDRHDSNLWLAEGDRARIDFDWARGKGPAVKSRYVCDGKAMGSDRAPGATKPAAKGIAAGLARGFARSGITALSEGSGLFERGGEAADGKQYALSGFAIGKKEKIGGREAQAIEFTVNAGKRDETKTVLWIDVKTGLAVRRTADTGGWVLTETYEVFELDAKLEDGVFTLPKGK
ncbi:MAG: hypothetical protein HYY18_16745 [Planctomycetes bacterium]|nr:hypothetical protein [Planctomycetota bacterium]